MHRRRFLSTALATSALAIAGKAESQTTTAATREFYQLRRYGMQSGPQTRLTETYIGEALIPALGRLGLGPVGAFKVDIGPETPAFHVLIPATSAETLATVDLRLADDAGFMKAAEPFWNAPATSPAFLRVESAMLTAFEGWPRVTPPAAAATKGKRIFQLRTYESASNFDHVRKVEMFSQGGEIGIFKNAGFHPVFFGDTLIGPRLPSLTYMMSFPDIDELNARWKIFAEDPAWKKLSTSPRYGYAEIVSNITNLILSPLAASQI